MIYLTLKLIHILSAIILFGLGSGTVFYKVMADRSGDHAAIAVTSAHVVLADWWFTTPTVIIQPLSGFFFSAAIIGFIWRWLAVVDCVALLNHRFMLVACGYSPNSDARYCRAIAGVTATFTHALSLLRQNLVMAGRSGIFRHDGNYHADGFSQFTLELKNESILIATSFRK